MPDPLVTPWTAAARWGLPVAPRSHGFPPLARVAVAGSACSSGNGPAVSLWSARVPVPRPLPTVDRLPTLLGVPAVPLPRSAEEPLTPLPARPAVV